MSHFLTAMVLLEAKRLTDTAAGQPLAGYPSTRTLGLALRVMATLEGRDIQSAVCEVRGERGVLELHFPEFSVELCSDGGRNRIHRPGAFKLPAETFPPSDAGEQALLEAICARVPSTIA